MAKAPKKSVESSFTEGKNGKRSPKPKSENPGGKSSGDKKRMGKNGKSVNY